MDEAIIPRPVVATAVRTLSTRRRAAPVVVPFAEPEKPAEPSPPVDVHAECRARERELVAQARRELEAAHAAEREAVRASAHREGAEAGREEGRRAALEEGRAANAALLERADALIAAIGAAHERALAAIEEPAVALGFAAACRILGTKVATPEGVRGIVEQLLAHARATERVTVRLNGEDLRLLRALGACGGLEAERHLDLVEDAKLATGDCCAESQSGTLEARLDAQVQALRDALLEARRARPPQEAA